MSCFGFDAKIVHYKEHPELLDPEARDNIS